jgi:alpha-beta hydrolase superfamily lysophospholipase
VACGAVLAFVNLAAQGVPRTPGLDRFTVQSDGHPMAVWARIPENPRRAILLIHGRTWSSRPDFDLQVPGLHRSVLADLAAQGVASYALDQRGYGETPRDATGWLTPKRAAADVANVLTWIATRHPALPKPALLGWSRGAAVAYLAAQNFTSRMSALILFGYVIDPDGEPFVDGLVADQPAKTKNTKEDAISDFIEPDVTPDAMVKAFVDTALKTDPILVDWKGEGEFSPLKAAAITVPTLLMHGEHDPNVPDDMAAKFFVKLGTPDRQYVVLPGADHCAQLEDTHDKFIAAIVGFLTRPAVSRK